MDFDGTLADLSLHYNWIEARRVLVEAIIQNCGYSIDQLISIMDPFTVYEVIKSRCIHLSEWASKVLEKYELRGIVRCNINHALIELSGIASSHGIRLCIVSLQSKKVIEHALFRYPSSSSTIIFGRDSAANPKPEPHHINACIGICGCNKAEVLMVGDGIIDARASKRAGIPFVGLESGLHTRYELCSEGAIAVFRNLSEFVEYIKYYFL